MLPSITAQMQPTRTNYKGEDDKGEIMINQMQVPMFGQPITDIIYTAIKWNVGTRTEGEVGLSQIGSKGVYLKQKPTAYEPVKIDWEYPGSEVYENNNELFHIENTQIDWQYGQWLTFFVRRHNFPEDPTHPYSYPKSEKYTTLAFWLHIPGQSQRGKWYCIVQLRLMKDLDVTFRESPYTGITPLPHPSDSFNLESPAGDVLEENKVIDEPITTSEINTVGLVTNVTTTGKFVNFRNFYRLGPNHNSHFDEWIFYGAVECEAVVSFPGASMPNNWSAFTDDEVWTLNTGNGNTTSAKNLKVRKLSVKPPLWGATHFKVTQIMQDHISWELEENSPPQFWFMAFYKDQFTSTLTVDGNARHLKFIHILSPNTQVTLVIQNIYGQQHSETVSVPANADK